MNQNETPSQVTNKGHGPVCRFLLAVGSTITFIRNTVFNVIFLILSLAVFCVFALVDSTESKDSGMFDSADVNQKVEKILQLKLDGPIYEMALPDDDYSKILRQLDAAINKTSVHDILSIEEAIDNAASDKRIELLYIDLSELSPVSLSVALRIKNAVSKFKQAKGEDSVIAFADYYTPSGFLIASEASKVILDPLGGFTFRGLSSSNLYIKDLLERFMIEPQVYRAGAFKSAVEPLISDHMSDGVKREYQQIFSSLWNDYLSNVNSHKNAGNTLKELFASADSYIQALKNARGSEADLLSDKGVVDELMSKLELNQKLIAQYGKSKTSEFAPVMTEYRQYLSLNRMYKQNSTDKPDLNSTASIAVIYGIDEITDASDCVTDFTPANIRSQLQSVLKDKSVKGVVFCINSGGGSVTASEQIRLMVQMLEKKGIKVYISMNSLCASGAYWISTAASKLYASKMTVTGSIGVFAVGFGADRLLNEYGVYEDGVETSELARNSLARAVPESHKQIITLEIQSIYQKFLSLVEKSRSRMSHKYNYTGYAEGKVFTAEEALKMHMIDKIGTLDDAIADLKNTLLKGDITKVEVKHIAPKVSDSADVLKALFAGKAYGIVPDAYLKQILNALCVKTDSKNTAPKIMAISAVGDMKY